MLRESMNMKVGYCWLFNMQRCPTLSLVRAVQKGDEQIEDARYEASEYCWYRKSHPSQVTFVRDSKRGGH